MCTVRYLIGQSLIQILAAFRFQSLRNGDVDNGDYGAVDLFSEKLKYTAFLSHHLAKSGITGLSISVENFPGISV